MEEHECLAADESQKQKRGHAGGTEKKKNSSFCYADGHLSSQEIEVGTTIFKKYKGRVVLRGDIVKGDSGSPAVFTEQGSSASQLTAAKVIDVIARLPGCAGQAAHAVSAYAKVKTEDAPVL